MENMFGGWNFRGWAMKKPKILIVEDVGMIADFMGLVLSRHGYHVSDVVASGEDAVDSALKTSPDLVLMDIKIDGVMDGITAAEMIRARSDIPIVYVTACTDNDVIARAMTTEPTAYLLKPFKSSDLICTIRKALE